MSSQHTFSSLGEQRFRWYWTSTLFTYGAAQMDAMIKGWLIFRMTGSSASIGVVTMAAGIPLVAASIFGGVLADRVDRMKFLLVTQVMATLLAVTMYVLLATGSIQYWNFILLAALQGTTFAFIAPLRQSIIARLVRPANLMSAVALSAGSYNVMGIVGPAAVGLMLAFIAPEQVYLVIIAFYVFGAVMLTFLKLPAGTSRLPGLSLSGLGEAFRFIGRERVVLGMLLTALTLSLFCIPYIYLLPALASDVLKVDQTGFGFLCAAAGTGALMGSLIAGSLASVRRKGMAVLLLAALFGAFLCLSGQSQAYPLALLLILCTALASSACMTLCNTLILTMTPPAMHGRVISIFTMTTGLTPMGALPMGAAADHFTLPVAFMASGIIAGTFAVSMWLASPSIRKMRQ